MRLATAARALALPVLTALAIVGVSVTTAPTATAASQDELHEWWCTALGGELHDKWVEWHDGTVSHETTCTFAHDNGATWEHDCHTVHDVVEITGCDEHPTQVSEPEPLPLPGNPCDYFELLSCGSGEPSAPTKHVPHANPGTTPAPAPDPTTEPPDPDPASPGDSCEAVACQAPVEPASVDPNAELGATQPPAPPVEPTPEPVRCLKLLCLGGAASSPASVNGTV